MLRLFYLGAVVLPLLLGAPAVYLSYRHSVERATTSAANVAGIAAENTAKVFDKYLLVAARINDLLGTMRGSQIFASEKVLHEWMSWQIINLQEVVATWVIDGNGHELVSARIYPVNRNLDQSGRDDYRALRDTDARMFVWMLRARRPEGGEAAPFLTVSVRRLSADGRFAGIVVVAVSGTYFASLYSAPPASAYDTATLLKGDGTVLAQFPPEAASGPGFADPLFAKSISNPASSGVAETGTPFDGAGRIVAVKRVAAYPIYVAISRSKALILQECLRSIAGFALVGLVAVVGLIVLSRTALRGARREHMALTRAGEASADRAALEVELHQARQLEAIGVLTAGVAHDFGNFLVNIHDIVERIEATVGGSDRHLLSLAAAAKKSCAEALTLSTKLYGFAAREPIKPRPININETVSRTLERSRRFGKLIVTEARLQEGLWRTRVDGHQLAAALLNLIFNARYAMADDAKLTFETANFTLDDTAVVGHQGAVPGDFVGLAIECSGSTAVSAIDKMLFDPVLTPSAIGTGIWFRRSLIHDVVQRCGGHWTLDCQEQRGVAIRLYFARHVPDPDGTGNLILARGSRASANNPLAL